MKQSREVMARHGFVHHMTVLLTGFNILITFTCILTNGASTASSASSTVPSTTTTLTNLYHHHNHNSQHQNNNQENAKDFTINNHNHNAKKSATSTTSTERNDIKIAELDSLSQYYYYQHALHHHQWLANPSPKVRLRFSSETGIVRPFEEEITTTTSTTTMTPNVNLNGNEEGDKEDDEEEDGFAEKLVSTIESPIYIYENSQEQQYSPSSMNNHQSSSLLSSLRTIQMPTFIRSNYSNNNSSESDSSSIETLQNQQTDRINSNKNEEQPNTIVQNEPSVSFNYNDNSYDDFNSNNNGNDGGSVGYVYGGGGGTGEGDDGSYDSHSQYSNSFSDYTDDELLENVADQAEIHNSYFIKTKPRDVNSNGANNKNRAVNDNDDDEDTFLIKQEPPINLELNEPSEPILPSSTPVTTNAHDAILPAEHNLEITSTTYDNNGDHQMFEEMPSSTTPSTMTEYEDVSSYHGGLIMTPTVASNLIADVTLKFGTTDSTSIPGIPGIDYPILDEIPYTGFDCQKQRYKGFFADLQTKCQAWHYCDFTDGHSTFLCPNGTLFSQTLLTCDWWFNVKCEESQQLYVLNERLYRYIKAPKLSFPEDYYGPQVDDWLLQQLQLGLLPKIKKKVKDKIVLQGNYN